MPSQVRRLIFTLVLNVHRISISKIRTAPWKRANDHDPGQASFGWEELKKCTLNCLLEKCWHRVPKRGQDRPGPCRWNALWMSTSNSARFDRSNKTPGPFQCIARGQRDCHRLCLILLLYQYTLPVPYDHAENEQSAEVFVPWGSICDEMLQFNLRSLRPALERQ